MRASFISAVILGFTTAAHAEPPRFCSPNPPIPDGAAASTATAIDVASGRSEAEMATEDKGSPAPLDDQTIAEAPILRHIAESGARLHELGLAHGLRMVLARKNDGFMIFEVAPDGQAAVAGLQSDLTVAQLRQLSGAVIELGVQHGLSGVLVRNGGQFQVMYAAPDGARLIPGVMWDADGRNITRAQIAAIPGTVPTVELAASDPAPPTTSRPTPALTAVAETTFGTYGASAAPRLWMFIDPKCPFSIRAMQQLQPLVDASKVQLAVIPLAVIDYENQGESTRATLALLGKPADEMVGDWRAANYAGDPAPSAKTSLERNTAAAQAIGLRGTPTFLWRRGDGTEGRADGLPPDLSALVASLGS